MRRWLTRWGASLRIARRDAARNRARTALVVALIALPVVGAVFVTTVLRSSVPTVQTQIQSMLGDDAAARLTPAFCGAPVQHDPLMTSFSCDEPDPAFTPASAADARSVLPDGLDLVPREDVTADIRTADALVPDESVAQLDAGAVPGLMRGADAVAGAGEIVLSTRVAGRLGVVPGDAVELVVGGEEVPVTVAAVGRETSETWAIVGPGTLPVDDATQTQWYAVGETPVTWDDVVALNAIGLEVASRAVFEDPPPAAEVYGGTFGAAGPSNSATIGLVAAIAAIGLLEVVLLIGPAFAVGARRSGRNLALVAASGGEPKDLRRIVVAAGIVAGAAASVLGIALGLVAGGAAYALLERGGYGWPNLVLPSWELAAIAAVAVVLGVAAAWVPARSAGKADVVAALAGRRAERVSAQRVPWLGIGLAVAGVAVAVVGALGTRPLLLVAGVLAMEVGLILAAGALVDLASRLAPRFSAPTRIALRDAGRHRSRTAPAVAAVLAAVAAATAGMVFTTGEARAQEASWVPMAADGVGYLSTMTPGMDLATADTLVEKSLAVLGAGGVAVTSAPVRAVVADDGFGYVELIAHPDPATVCPDGETQGPDATDERCRYDATITSTFSFHGQQVVDDGTFVGLTGLPGAADAAAALADGTVVVNDPEYVWPDGMVHLTIGSAANGGGDAAVELTARAHLVDWPHWQYGLVLSPTVADRLDLGAHDAQVAAVGALVVPDEPFTQAQVDSLNRELSDVGANVHLIVEGMQYREDTVAISLIIAGAAALIALVATALCVGLAAADSRPDLATLGAVGASPATRRRVAGAQAGVVVVIGTGVGVGTGLLLGYVLAIWQRHGGQWGPLWEFTVPWQGVLVLAAGLPLVAVVGAMALTRGRLPMVRRLAQ